MPRIVTLDEKLSRSLHRLRSSAAELNSLTEAIAETVARVERFLVAECQVGIETYVEIGLYDGVTYDLGYRRLGNNWRIVLEARQPGVPNRPWSDCSRDLKLWSAPALPALIEDLDEQVSNRVSRAQDALGKVEGAFFGLAEAED